jgi:uncharacterized protein
MPEAVTIHVKAVPGARRNEVAGWLGDRLKVRISAPAEGGRANAAICELLARAAGVKPGAVTLVRGRGSAEKTVRIEGLGPSDVDRIWPRD